MTENEANWDGKGEYRKGKERRERVVLVTSRIVMPLAKLQRGGRDTEKNRCRKRYGLREIEQREEMTER